MNDSNNFSTEELQICYQAGKAILDFQSNLAESGKTILDLILNNKPHQAWEHFPWQGGILDQRNSSQYFYHTHEDYEGEHGHFHTFYYHQRELVHLIAIGMDGDGELAKLYTFNCWGPGDRYFPAEQLKAFLPKFRIEGKQKFDPRIHSFVQNTLIFFKNEIEALFVERDATFQRYREENEGADPYEDRSLEITSTLDVDLDAKMDHLRKILEQRKISLPSIAVQESLEPKPFHPPLPSEASFSLENLTLKALQNSHNAGKEWLKIVEHFNAENKTILDAVMNEQPFEVWKMYPWDGGIYDQPNKSQYFYHSHPQSPEHGHFHTFFHHQKQLVHLIAIALDNQGEPIELMTVNRWVTGDLYVPAKKLKQFLPRFRVQNRKLDQRIHQYVRHLLHLYQPEIQILMDQREETFQHYRQQHQGQSPFEDRTLEVTSSLKIEVSSHLQQLEQAIHRHSS